MITEKLDVINNVMTLFKGREMVYVFESGIFLLSNQPRVTKPEKSSSSEHSSDYYESISSEQKISGRGHKY